MYSLRTVPVLWKRYLYHHIYANRDFLVASEQPGLKRIESVTRDVKIVVIGLLLTHYQPPPDAATTVSKARTGLRPDICVERSRGVLVLIGKKDYITLHTPQISQKATPTSPNVLLRVFQRSYTIARELQLQQRARPPALLSLTNCCNNALRASSAPV